MFKNLNAEFARKGLSANNEVAKILGCTDRSARNKLTGKTSLTVREAEAIKNSLFSQLTLDYLFATEEQSETKNKALQQTVIEKLKRISE